MIAGTRQSIAPEAMRRSPPRHRSKAPARTVGLGLAVLVVGVTQPLIRFHAQAHAQSGPGAEALAVIREACGLDPTPACVAGLRKICHRAMTLRCYLSRKGRIDSTPSSETRMDEAGPTMFYVE